MIETLNKLKERTSIHIYIMATSLHVIIILSTIAIGIGTIYLLQNYQNNFIHNFILILNGGLTLGIYLFYYAQRNIRKDVEGFFDNEIKKINNEEQQNG